MSRPYKVYTTSFGRYRRIVATQTKKAAMEALHITPHTAREFMGESGNEADYKQAMTEPGVVFRRRGYGPNDEWERNDNAVY